VDGAPERYGSYLVHEQIGLGGMAKVHRAEQEVVARGKPTATRAVALKRLLPTLDKELVKLFLDEAKLLRYLDHPNIAATYDSGRVFGTYFIAMEYVRGPTLKELVQRAGATVGPVPQPITLNLAAQLCEALDYAHNATDENGNSLGIIHRDVTPANMILSETGLLKLIDFGLAKASLSTETTGMNIIKGKFGYVAPEYLEGKLDHRVDLWATGIIMYELLTSRRLFDGADNLETMTRVRNFPIPRPSIANPQVTRELDEIVMTALARDPDLRWPSASAMKDALRAVIKRPGNYIDNQGVAAWVRRVFDDQHAAGGDNARAPQLTPILAAPVASLPTRSPRRPPAAATVEADDEATEIAMDPFDDEPSTFAEPQEPAFHPVSYDSTPQPPRPHAMQPQLAMEQIGLPPPPPISMVPAVLLLLYAGAIVLTVLIFVVWKIVG
jgi:serine/threonine protein kinase